MGKYNAHERTLIRRLEEQNELLTEQLKEQKDANLKLEDIKDAGDPAGKGEIHGFYFPPVGEGPVADDEGIGVTDPGNEI